MKACILIVLIVTLSACASVHLPPEVAAVTLERIPSQAVAIYQPKIVMKDGQLLLDGWVYRQFGAATTAQSHLDIAFLDPSGRELRRETTNFAPRDLRGGGHRMQPRGHYTLPISSMPAGTIKIEVRAHDGAHE